MTASGALGVTVRVGLAVVAGAVVLTACGPVRGPAAEAPGADPLAGIEATVDQVEHGFADDATDPATDPATDDAADPAAAVPGPVGRSGP